MSLTALVARLPLSMAGIALLLLVVQHTGSYAVAGAVQASWVVSEALVAPWVARLVDRFGQPTIVGPQVGINIVATAALIAVVVTDQPRWTWFLAAIVAGAALPVIGALVRARWAFLLGTSPVLRTAYSWESVADEVVFVLGPPAATVMAVALGASTALALTIAIGSSGTALLLAQRRSQPPARPQHHTAGAGSALRFRGMAVLVVVMILLGAVFAGVEVAVIAIAREAGETGTAGVVLALWALGSLLAGLVVGSLRRAPSLPTQLQLGAVAITVTLLPLLFTDNLRVIAPVLFVAGVGVSPSLIAGFALVEKLVPAARLTEGLTFITTGISLGFAVGSPFTGLVIDVFGPHQGFFVGLSAALAAALAVLLARPRWEAVIAHA